MDRANQLLRDAGFTETKALGTSDATVVTTGFDLGALSARGARLADVELKLDAPALNTTQLPNADTCTYSVETCDDNSSWATILTAALLVQTGAGGAGAAAASARFRLPSDCERYVRVKAILAGTTGDCSAASLVASLVF